MKKHEKLIKAMQDYPAGVKYKSLYLKGTVWESSGWFFISNNDGSVGDVVDKIYGNIIYAADLDKWAEVVKPTFDFSVNLSDPVYLAGKRIDRAVHTKKPNDKVAIHTANEREFNLLMRHYSEKGWRIKPYTDKYPYVVYKSNCDRLPDPFPGFEIVPFEQFAKSVGIEIPVKLLTSEDGVDLYAEDSFYATRKNHVGWSLDTYGGEPYRLANASKVVIHPDKFKAFSTKEAAEAWVKKQNQYIGTIIAEGPGYVVKVTEAGASISSKGGFTLSLEEVEHIYTVLKGLNK